MTGNQGHPRDYLHSCTQTLNFIILHVDNFLMIIQATMSYIYKATPHCFPFRQEV